MNIVKFNDVKNLQDEMNRLFSLSFPRFENREEIVRGAWSPSVDIIEGKEEIAIEAELAGMNIEDVDVSIENNVITISGERKFEKKDESENYHRVERSYGTFTRSFTLPRNVVSDEAKAEFKNGILRVTLPKKEEAKARKIEIKSVDAVAKAAKA
ncbi:MAG: Hsp20/alpha crystallin family protein [Pyrinomonadaceae bacterium]|jgi:HSP20 family protein|nr:Hsp20/alpha crystallin family protein [Pyrinomonadaceae bacterium]